MAIKHIILGGLGDIHKIVTEGYDVGAALTVETADAHDPKPSYQAHAPGAAFDAHDPSPRYEATT